LPTERHADVARHAIWEIDDLATQTVPARAQVRVPEQVKLFRQSGESVFPARLHLIDGTFVIGADGVREPNDLNLRESVVHSPLYYCFRAIKTTLVCSAIGVTPGHMSGKMLIAKTINDKMSSKEQARASLYGRGESIALSFFINSDAHSNVADNLLLDTISCDTQR
jgi:hypothetical protein